MTATKTAPKRVTIDGSIVLDASITERHGFAVEVTKHPVESGASPVDHAREQPDKLQIEGLVTNTALDSATRAARGGETKPRQAGYAQEQLARLLELKSSRRAVTVETAARTYKDMVLTAIDLPIDSRTGDAYRFTLQFEQVRFVTSRRVTLARPTSVPQKPTKKVKQDKKPPIPATPQRRSILKTLTDSAGLTSPGSGVTP